MTKKQEIQDNDPDVKWEISRKKFITGLLASGVALQLPFLMSCNSNSEKTKLVLDGKSIFSEKEMEFVHQIQNVLFPPGDGPSAEELNAHNYIVWIFSENRTDEYFVTSYKSKLKELIELYQQKSKPDLNELVESTINTKQFQSWYSRNLTIIFESLLLDPIYGVNTDQKGWKWVNHNPGFPRPSEHNVLDKITR